VRSKADTSQLNLPHGTNNNEAKCDELADQIRTAPDDTVVISSE